MKAKYFYQCRLSGNRITVTFLDKLDLTIESQALEFSKSTNHEITGYTYSN